MSRLIIEEEYSRYQFEVWVYQDEDGVDTKYYHYKILDKNSWGTHMTGNAVIRESDEDFDCASEARLAAIGHISLLEDGEG